MSGPKACDWRAYNTAPVCSHSYLVDLVVKLASRRQPTTALDIGTGNGATLAAWLAQGWRVCATEPDPQGFALAKSVRGADVRCLGVEDALPPDWREVFDLVICLEVVEHLYDPHQLVSQAREALKPGGFAIVSTPYHGYLKNLAIAIYDKWDSHHHPHVVGGHIKFWSKPTLKSLFEKSDFQAVGFHGAGRLPYLWNSMVWVFQKM